MRSTGERKEKLIHGALFAAAAFSVIVVFLIILFLFMDAQKAFQEIGLIQFITGREWKPVSEPPRFGALPLITGTLFVTLGTAVIAVPLGIGSAIFISEIAPPMIKGFLKATVEVLAGIPSVVFGFFGLIVLTDWIRITFDKPTGETWLAGSILLAIMALPTIITVAEDAISSVPREYREASLALGATRWQTIKSVIVPSAMSGITAAVILGMGRAIGETMAVMMVTGNAAVIPEPITNVFSPIRTITGSIGIEMGETPTGSLHYHALFALALILFVIVLVINTVANHIMGRMRAVQAGTSKRKMSERKRRYMGHGICTALYLSGFWVLWSWFGMAWAVLIAVSFIAVIYLRRRIPAKISEKMAFIMLFLSIMAVMFFLGIILYDIFSNGISVVSMDFLTQPPRDMGREGGIFPAIIGTLYLVLGAIAMALPLGVGAAIYLNEYTGEGRLKRMIRTGVENLNGTPSIVFGLFGYSFLVIYLNFGVSLIAGQITLALMVLPTIIRTSEEALRSVPDSIREASFALGAGRWQTTTRAVLPSAMPGIITGTILSIGRSAGETAPIMFTAAVFTQRYLPTSLSDPIMALSYHLFVLTTSVPGGESNAYGTATVLLLLVMSMYSAAIFIRSRYRKKGGFT